MGYFLWYFNASQVAEDKKDDKTPTWALSRFLKELSQPKAGLLIEPDANQGQFLSDLDFSP